MNDQGPYKRRESYSVYGLWAAGSRFYVDEYTKEEAIQDYLELHPDANEMAVRAEMEAEMQPKDQKTYTVYGLLAAGSRFTDDYDETDALEHYLELHPESDRQAVKAELEAEIKRRR